MWERVLSMTVFNTDIQIFVITSVIFVSILFIGDFIKKSYEKDQAKKSRLADKEEIRELRLKEFNDHNQSLVDSRTAGFPRYPQLATYTPQSSPIDDDCKIYNWQTMGL